MLGCCYIRECANVNLIFEHLEGYIYDTCTKHQESLENSPAAILSPALHCSHLAHENELHQGAPKGCSPTCRTPTRRDLSQVSLSL